MTSLLASGLSAKKLVKKMKWWKEIRKKYKQRRVHKLCTSFGDRNELLIKIERRKPNGNIDIGSGNSLAGIMILEIESSKILIGNDVFINSGTIIDCVQRIQIDDNVIISYDCIITDTDAHSIDADQRKIDMKKWKNGNYDWSYVSTKPIHIMQGAWIGARACILKGVTIGEGAVVGMASVVTKDVEPYTLVAGNPARVIKKLQRSDAGF
jgi:galactoside O-acetyltransferase